MNGIFDGLKTPCYVIDEAKLLKNAEVLASVMSHTGCKILLAQKAFSNYDFYPLLSGYLAGTEASGLYEARLGKESFQLLRDVLCHLFVDRQQGAVLIQQLLAVRVGYLFGAAHISV